MHFTDSTNAVLSVEEVRWHREVRRYQGVKVSRDKEDETENSREEYENGSNDDEDDGAPEPFGWGTSWEESYHDMLDSRSGVLGSNIEWLEI
ncbi:hypothetical protein INT45_006304 [Circinella minor]|uniref:Uncharacterized protein n=1 Tax=Circinella minor TaxID=1195481 RepID=A0A8H7VJ12_9FUNG|nr:hypothetical protein INT45_006304 [Circinella minor]